MIIPNYVDIPIVDPKTGLVSDEWKVILQQLLSQLQKNVGTEGFVIPSISSDPNSVSPPAAGGQLLQLQNTFNPAPPIGSIQPGVVAGTIVFDPFEVNGGAPRNGQLKVLLNDGIFHPITNT